MGHARQSIKSLESSVMITPRMTSSWGDGQNAIKEAAKRCTLLNWTREARVPTGRAVIKGPTLINKEKICAL
jgi:hypothetical protein